MQQESSDLLGFVESMAGDEVLRVEEDLGDGFVKLRVGEAERRQAKHDIQQVEDIFVEMLRNARDAKAKHIFVATSRDADLRTIVMLDDGAGIPESLQKRVFDARVTSKLESVHMDKWGVHGRGMALYSIKENVRSAEVVSSAAGKGSSIRIVADVNDLPEKSDQSTWPSLGVDEDGVQAVAKGPHNIIRTCCEFALEERGNCEVYLGSQAEIAATAHTRVKSSLSDSDLLFVDDVSTLPVLERLAVAADATEMREISDSLGLEMSERTAHRIMSGQIKPLRSVLARLTHSSDKGPQGDVDLARDRRGLRLSQEDAEVFSRKMERDFDYLAQRYYISLSASPRVRVAKNKVTVTFEVEKSD